MTNSELTRTESGSRVAAKKREFGVLYVLDEKQSYELMLQLSLESLDQFHADWPRHIVRLLMPHAPLSARLKRCGAFWRWKRLYNRFGQNSRFYKAKASALIDSPFEHTLFLDVDTVIRRPLDSFREKSMYCDAMFTSMHWKKYPRITPDLPEQIPFVMSGVFFYSRAYANFCRPLFERFGDRLHEVVDGLTISDQFIFSLACVLGHDELDIQYEPRLQIDVINAQHHLRTDELRMNGKCIDVRWEALNPFHVFHYNEYKPQYMRQIEQVWGLPNGRRATA